MLSFIIPAYNEERELPRALASIRAAAEAVGEPYEIIVVDDASNDATAEIATAAGARLVSVAFRQIAAVRNAGARVARGDILFFVDADTRIAPAHLRDALAALEAGYAGGSARIVFDGVVPLGARIFLRVFALFYFGAKLGAGAFLFMKRASFEAIGGFSERYFAGEEMYLSRALKKLGPFTILRTPAVTSGRKVRMHTGASLLRQLFSFVIHGEQVLTVRSQLGFWYDGKREEAPLAGVSPSTTSH